jgi:hypothetical protein
MVSPIESPYSHVKGVPSVHQRTVPCVYLRIVHHPNPPFTYVSASRTPSHRATVAGMAGQGKGTNTLCNVPQVSFLEAAHPVADKPDTFRLYYGGSDAVIGTAVVTFAKVAGTTCE